MLTHPHALKSIPHTRLTITTDDHHAAPNDQNFSIVNQPISPSSSFVWNVSLAKAFQGVLISLEGTGTVVNGGINPAILHVWTDSTRTFGYSSFPTGTAAYGCLYSKAASDPQLTVSGLFGKSIVVTDAVISGTTLQITFRNTDVSTTNNMTARMKVLPK